VDPPCSRVGEPTRHRDRVVVVDGLGVEVPAPEADAPAVPQIDRGIDVECQR
jgi:hypothetical protein